jgi:hypothetical protein
MERLLVLQKQADDHEKHDRADHPELEHVRDVEFVEPHSILIGTAARALKAPRDAAARAGCRLAADIAFIRGNAWPARAQPAQDSRGFRA